MVEKIYVRPEEVRGLGNIVIPKSLEDYETYKSVLAEGSDEVYGTVYSMSHYSFDDFTLTSDKDILSYNGGTNPDTATLTAQLTYEGEPALVEGETVTFEVRKQSDDSLVETLSDVTDSSGVATVSYTSNGAGDLYIKAECSLVSKIFAIQDIYLYDECTSAKHGWKNGSGTCSYSYSSNGMSITGSAVNGASLLLDETLPNHYSVEFTITGMQSNVAKCSGFGLETVYLDPRSSNSILANVTDWTTINNVINVNDTIKMEWDGTKVTFYQNGTKITEYNKNGSGVNNGLFFRNLTNNSGWTGITIKDLKIREL